MKDRLITVIIPAYKAGNYIKETIQGVLDQTHTNFELIIVDDGSSDGTEQILKKYKIKWGLTLY